jgi:uncharacterized protein
MGSDENIANTKKGFAAFAAGDVATVMELMAEEVEWTTPGNSSVSGTIHGKEELGAFFAKLAEKGFATNAQHYFADDERVVVLTQVSAGGETADDVDVFVFNADGKVIMHQSANDTAMLERVFGSK